MFVLQAVHRDWAVVGLDKSRNLMLNEMVSLPLFSVQSFLTRELFCSSWFLPIEEGPTLPHVV